MEKTITDLFDDSAITNMKGPSGRSGGPGLNGKSSKSSDLKSSAITEAMKLMSNPKKLKGVIIALISLLLIGIFSIIAFFVIYPVCILWAMVSYIVIAIVGRIIKYRKNVISKRDN